MSKHLELNVDAIWMLLEQEYRGLLRRLCNIWSSFQILTNVNLGFHPWQQSSARSENNCCLSKKNFGCVCLKHGPEFKRFKEIVKHKFRTDFSNYCILMVTVII